ncbi:MAG: glycosyl transferase family 1 [Rhodopirellula sp. TMED11]|nr:MAG: glycosyl transferase family 1 [Rhodopirellula sp. TMED11]
MKIVFLTAGAAGMFCGSCMHDNALARALNDRGAECLLQPVYTPIRTDEIDVSGQRVFLGGIHVYLLQQFPWLRHLPRAFRSVLDFPPLIRWATRNAGGTDAKTLGALSVSMLRGAQGNQAGEFEELNDWICKAFQPDAVVFTNLLIGGGIPELKQQRPQTKVVVMLQGDDIFLDHLPEKHRAQAIELCQQLVPLVDCFCSHSQFYADKMSRLLNIPADKLVITPLSVDHQPFDPACLVEGAGLSQPSEFRLGYLARIAKEKGLQRLVDAFVLIAMEHPEVTLHAAGWLGPSGKPYLEAIESQLQDAGLSERFHYHGSPDLAGKAAFLRSLDVLSVPTEYEDPKGLFVLESLASGTPVVMPDHGAFGELIRSTGGGVLVPPGDPRALAEAIIEIKNDELKRQQLAAQGLEGVKTKHTIDRAAEHVLEIIGELS